MFGLINQTIFSAAGLGDERGLNALRMSHRECLYTLLPASGLAAADTAIFCSLIGTAYRPKSQSFYTIPSCCEAQDDLDHLSGDVLVKIASSDEA